MNQKTRLNIIQSRKGSVPLQEAQVAARGNLKSSKRI
jgi:hypothetical protein